VEECPFSKVDKLHQSIGMQRRDVFNACITFTKTFDIVFISGLCLQTLAEFQEEKHMQMGVVIEGASFKLKLDLGEDG
ncbi:hypothetical protein F8388_016562, partial [Cannabis sativa]